METTLILLKPDCVTKGHCGEVIRRLEAAGLTIRGCKMTRLSEEKLREHYAHIADRPFYPEVEEFMRSSPVMVLAVAGERAIERVRYLSGVTDSRKAKLGTIRGDLGIDVMANVIHASDAPEAAETEIRRFFEPHELYDYRRPYQPVPV